jgi:hypothetical protein
MNQELTLKEKTILKVVGVVLLFALLSSMTSCSRHTMCQRVQTKMCGYR